MKIYILILELSRIENRTGVLVSTLVTLILILDFCLVRFGYSLFSCQGYYLLLWKAKKTMQANPVCWMVVLIWSATSLLLLHPRLLQMGNEKWQKSFFFSKNCRDILQDILQDIFQPEISISSFCRTYLRSSIAIHYHIKLYSR